MNQTPATGNPALSRRVFCIGLVVFSLAYLILRLPHLLLLPPFNDELNNLRYTQLITQGWEHLFVAYTAVGKQSLYLWLSALAWPLFDDPLTTLRVVAVAFGLGSLWAMMLLARKLFGERFPWLPLVAGTLYVLSPYTVFHERMALYEPLVNVINLVSFFLALRLVERCRWRDAVYLGLLLGLGLITKRYCFFFLSYPFLVLFERWLVEKRRPALQLIGLAVAAVVLAVAIRYAVNIKPFYFLDTASHDIGFGSYMVADAAAALRRIGPNLLHVGLVYYHYIGLPLMALIAGAVVLTIVRRPAGMIAPLLVALGATALQVVLTERMIFARYLFFTFPYLLLAAMYFLFTAAHWLARRLRQNVALLRARLALVGITATVIGLLYLSTSLAIVRDPTTAPLDPIDRWQHVTGWAAGYGLHEAMAYMEKEAERVGEPLDLFFHYDSLGIPFHGFRVYLGDHPGLRYHLSSWDRRMPLLFFVARNGVVEHPACNSYRLIETLRPEQMKHVYFLGVTPLLDRKQFVHFNGEPLAEALFPKPGGESAVVVMKLRVPALGEAGI